MQLDGGIFSMSLNNPAVSQRLYLAWAMGLTSPEGTRDLSP